MAQGQSVSSLESTIQRAVSRAAENIRARWRGVMTRLTRREFLRTSASGAGLALLAAGCGPAIKGDFAPKAGRRVVVIGGGWGGATAAKYLRLADASIEVVLLEPNRQFVSCPFSNLVLSGVRSIDGLTFGYGGLRSHGVRGYHEAASAIEPDVRRVRGGGGYLEDDRLIVSPGVEFPWEQVDGLAAAQERVLHPWKAGPQTVERARHLAARPDGGVFVLTVPPVWGPAFHAWSTRDRKSTRLNSSH